MLIFWLYMPIFAFLVATFRGLLLFWPVMLLLGAFHSYVESVPALGWQPSFLLVVILALLLPIDVKSK